MSREYYQYLRGDRPGDESEGARQMRGHRRTTATQALEGAAFFDGVPAYLVAWQSGTLSGRGLVMLAITNNLRPQRYITTITGGEYGADSSQAVR